MDLFHFTDTLLQKGMAMVLSLSLILASVGLSNGFQRSDRPSGTIPAQSVSVYLAEAVTPAIVEMQLQRGGFAFKNRIRRIEEVPVRDANRWPQRYVFFKEELRDSLGSPAVWGVLGSAVILDAVYISHLISLTALSPAILPTLSVVGIVFPILRAAFIAANFGRRQPQGRFLASIVILGAELLLLGGLYFLIATIFQAPPSGHYNFAGMREAAPAAAGMWAVLAPATLIRLQRHLMDALEGFEPVAQFGVGADDPQGPRHTMPAKTGRFGNPRPAVHDHSRGLKVPEIDRWLSQGRIVYGIFGRRAREFVKSVPESNDLYSLRRDAEGQLVAALNREDTFLRVFKMRPDKSVEDRQSWGAPLPIREYMRLQRALADAVEAHKKNVRDISPIAVDHLIFNASGSLDVEVRQTHDVFSEAGMSNGTKATIILDRALLKDEENYEVLVNAIINELGHLVTRQGDKLNTPNSIRVWAMRMFDNAPGDIRQTMRWFGVTLAFFGFPPDEMHSLLRAIAERLEPLSYQPTVRQRIQFSRVIEDLSQSIADRLLELRGELEGDRWTMPGIHIFQSPADAAVAAHSEAKAA